MSQDVNSTTYAGSHVKAAARQYITFADLEVGDVFTFALGHAAWVKMGPTDAHGHPRSSCHMYGIGGGEAVVLTESEGEECER